MVPATVPAWGTSSPRTTCSFSGSVILEHLGACALQSVVARQTRIHSPGGGAPAGLLLSSRPGCLVLSVWRAAGGHTLRDP